MVKEITLNVAVHLSDFPEVSFKATDLPVDAVIDDKGGKVCKNIKEARKYAGQQFERLITKSIAELYSHKDKITTIELTNNGI